MAQKKEVFGADFIKEEIKTGPSGVYFFYGEEDYLKQYYLHEIEKVVVGDRSNVNFKRLTNDEFTPGDLEEALNSASMFDFFAMAEEDDTGKLIEIYEVDFKSLKPNDFAETLKILGNAPSDSVVVVYSTSAEMPQDSKVHQNLTRELCKVTKAVSFPYESDAKLCSWLSKIAAKNKVELDPLLARMLIERVGHSMLLLKSELDKIIAYVSSQSRNKVVSDDIYNIIASNKEISPFDFTNALMKRDGARAFYILSDMKSRCEEPIIILSTVSRVISDLIRVRGCMDEGLTRAETAAKCSMHEYKVKLYMESLKNTSISKLFSIAESASRADIMLKSSPIDSYTVLERLICEIAGVK